MPSAFVRLNLLLPSFCLSLPFHQLFAPTHQPTHHIIALLFQRLFARALEIKYFTNGEKFFKNILEYIWNQSMQQNYINLLRLFSESKFVPPSPGLTVNLSLFMKNPLPTLPSFLENQTIIRELVIAYLRPLDWRKAIFSYFDIAPNCQFFTKSIFSGGWRPSSESRWHL